MGEWNQLYSGIYVSIFIRCTFERGWLILAEGRERIKDHIPFQGKAIELRKTKKLFNLAWIHRRIRAAFHGESRVFELRDVISI